MSLARSTNGFLCGVVLVCLVSASEVRGQDPKEQQSVGSEITTSSFGMPVEIVLSKNQDDGKFEISSSQLTIGQYVEFLRKQPYFSKVNIDGKGVKKSQKLNVIVTDRAKNFKLPEIQITTDVDGALSCLSQLGNDENEIMVDDIGDDVFKVDVVSHVDTSVAVINAKQLLSSVEEADLLSAIEIGFRMKGNVNAVQLHLHKETGLLFVKGDLSETRLVDEIVQELMVGYRIKRYPNPSAGGASGAGGGMIGGGVSGGGADGGLGGGMDSSGKKGGGK